MMEICAGAIKSEVSVSTFSWSFSPCKRFYPPGHALFEVLLLGFFTKLVQLNRLIR